ncbi:MAG: hypothetical protein EA364_00740 [Balneolaceae bacterium]|nr:MAG: hypothetical protein EA364_00740 [Balneolaceae bacterium]
MNNHFKSEKNMNRIMKTIRIQMFVAALAGITLLTSCGDLLEVNDPGAIELDQLNDPKLEQLIMNGVLSEFQYAFNYMTLTASILSDEVFTDHTNIDHREWALFDIRTNNILNNNTYTFLQKARVSAEDAAGRIAGFDGGNPLNVAESYAYAGYANLMLGLHFCESPINGGPALTWQEILARAIGNFEQAVTRAAAGQATDAARASRITNMARVGIARANLQLGNMTQAASFASQVPADFEAWVYRSSNSSRETNINAAQWISSDPWMGIDPKFLNLNDPRVRHPATPSFGLNANEVYLPYRPRSYQGWNAETPQTIDLNTGYLFSSGLEARYIAAEANGPTGTTLTLVNERRAVGGQAAVNLTGDALMAELRNQKARDFFLTVQRLGDMRRYLNLYGVDEFPSGAYPVGNAVYGNARCMIIPLSEINGNPNL